MVSLYRWERWKALKCILLNTVFFKWKTCYSYNISILICICKNGKQSDISQAHRLPRGDLHSVRHLWCRFVRTNQSRSRFRLVCFRFTQWAATWPETEVTSVSSWSGLEFWIQNASHFVIICWYRPRSIQVSWRWIQSEVLPETSIDTGPRYYW